ncbi:hypothetical protein WJ976_03095 [Achromobacter denitrificans]
MQIEVMVNWVIEPNPTAPITASSLSVPRYSSDRNSTANTASMLAQPVRIISITWPPSGPVTKRAWGSGALKPAAYRASAPGAGATAQAIPRAAFRAPRARTAG